jgi:hypothetical protein
MFTDCARDTLGIATVPVAATPAATAPVLRNLRRETGALSAFVILGFLRFSRFLLSIEQLTDSTLEVSSAWALLIDYYSTARACQRLRGWR